MKIIETFYSLMSMPTTKALSFLFLNQMFLHSVGCLQSLMRARCRVRIEEFHCFSLQTVVGEGRIEQSIMNNTKQSSLK